MSLYSQFTPTELILNKELVFIKAAEVFEKGNPNAPGLTKLKAMIDTKLKPGIPTLKEKVRKEKRGKNQ